ncbi:hypothetical protein CI109_106702 [Kwoniella shandongensis]|uniref:Uncharacterized protein n=1 Tax=Kwoniella shandongensis TaxID=1734106 RepID=A0A5M6BT93_9TREE|nr:uncharacterized protein CI109_006440 [Kwoniella shandongensis]KAA5525270.1 hypothetical protein CI109_006440 [Kwoniella shandongensis]
MPKDTTHTVDQLPVNNSSRQRSNPRLACEACRDRKLKCNGERPACARCLRTQRTCEYVGDDNGWGHQFSTLESRLRAVEDLARDTQSLNNADPTRNQSGIPVVSPSSSTASHVHRNRDASSTPHSQPFLSIPTPSQSAPFVAMSSIQSSLPSNAQLLNTFAEGQDGQDIISVLQRPITTTPNSESLITYDRSFLPSPDLILGLIDQFSFHHNAAYPIFHMPTLRLQVQSVCLGTGRCSPHDFCAVFHVLALAAAALTPRSPLYHALKPLATTFWNAAQTYLGTALAHLSISRLQILLAHLRYLMFNPGGMSVWDLSGMAVRTAIDLGLHNEPAGFNQRQARGPLELDMRRRLFWVAYSTDRMLCLLLGRPTAISDTWISSSFPLPYDDELITADALLPGPTSPIKATVLHHFRVRLIQSEIHERLYSPNSPCPSRDWFEHIAQKLKEWTDNCPPTTGFISREWLEINVSLTQVQLYRPSPANPNPGREDLEKAFAAAGELMRVYRVWQRAGQVNSLWLASYQLFIAGLTYLNSLWQAHRAGWSIVPSMVDALLHVQMCSNTMEAIAVSTPETANLRDAFETVSEQIIRQLAAKEQWSSTTQHQQQQQQPPNAPNPIYFAGSTNNITPSVNAAAVLDTLEDANPFDEFFLQPMGGLSSSDWTKSIDSAVELLQGFGA